MCEGLSKKMKRFYEENADFRRFVDESEGLRQRPVIHPANTDGARSISRNAERRHQ